MSGRNLGNYQSSFKSTSSNGYPSYSSKRGNTPKRGNTENQNRGSNYHSKTNSTSQSHSNNIPHHLPHVARPLYTQPKSKPKAYGYTHTHSSSNSMQPMMNGNSQYKKPTLNTQSQTPASHGMNHKKKTNNLFREYNVTYKYTPKSYESPQKQWRVNHSPFSHDDFKQMDHDSQALVIADYLEKVPLLARLQKNDRYKLGKLFKDKSYKNNEIVIRQGDAGSEFYIIKEGEASVIVQNEESKQETEVATLKPGDYFGETALLTDKPRNATVKAINGSLKTLTLDKDTFIATFGKDRVKANFGKRGAISAEKLLPNQNSNGRFIRRPSCVTTDKDEDLKELIANAVENNVLFAALDDDQVNRIVEVMWQLDVKKGTNIINQGEPGDNFYVVEKGIFDIFVKHNQSNDLVSTRTSGESFGELALMYNSPRSATVTARTDCKVWAVERYMFRKILIRVSEDKLQEYERFLARVPLLDSLLTNERRAVAEALDEVHFKRGDRIVEQGEQGDTFYIVKKGEAKVTKRKRWDQKPQEVLRLKPGDFFGERALVKNEARAATVTVVDGPMTCLSLDREAFCLLLGPLAELMHRKIDREYDGIKTPQMIPKQPQNVPNMNNLNLSNNSAQNGTLLPPNKSNNIINNSNTNTNNNNKLQIQANGKRQNEAKEEENKNTNSEEKNKKASHILNIKQSELSKIGVLGRGSFGMVELVKHAKSKRTFALKSVAKAEIVKTGQQEHIISEKNVMIMLDSRFIVKLFQTYNTQKYLYFLLEVVLGGELFTVLRQRTVFDESTARFYAASVVCAFGYMHDKNVIYRDLKPENLLLDNGGYLKITDFGFAKIVTDRTYTLCGTPDYLAPEVISGAGHGKGVDWWTLGILLFEMLASYPPFYDEDPMRTYAKIMYGKVKYPKHFSHDAVEVIKGFLTAKATKRLGIIKGGVKKIENYKWFHAFDWKSLKNGTMKAPIIPNVSGIEDRSNFEVYDDHEEIDDDYHDDGTGWDKDF